MRLHVSISKWIYILCIYIPIIGSLFVRISFCMIVLYFFIIFLALFFHLLSNSKKKATKRESDDDVSYLSIDIIHILTEEEDIINYISLRERNIATDKPKY